MRALTIVYILLACTVAGFSQTTATYDNVRARQQLTLNGHTLTSVLQTIDSLSTHAQGVTAKAVYDYIATKYSTVSAGTGIDVVKAGSNYTISLDTLKRLHFRTDSTYTGGVGTMRWNLTDGTLDLGLLGGNVTLQLGQESVQRVKHADNSGLTEGKAVYIVGSSGDNLTVRYAQANTESTSANTFGVMTESASGGDKAFCTTFGLVRNINTSNLTEGGMVWLSKDTAGAMTAVRPSAPNHGVEIGFCVRKHATTGVIFVTIQNGYELRELHDVYAPSPSNNQSLLWKSANSRWEAAAVDTSLTNEGRLIGFKPSNNSYYNIGSSTNGSSPIILYRGSGIGFSGTSGSPEGGDLTISNTGDLDSGNEGILGVGAGTATSSVITSNTSGASGVTINASGGISISETTSSNGGSINLSATDQSISNEGILGVAINPGADAWLRSNTSTANDIGLVGTNNTTINATASSNGGQIVIDSKARIDTFSLSGQTLRASLLNDGVAASSVTLPIVDVVAGTNVTVSKSNGVATVSATGGGGGTPAGSTGEIQYNNAGAFGASSNLAWDNSNARFNIGAPSSPTGSLNVRGSGTLTTVNTRLTNSGHAELLKVLDNGSTNIGDNFNWDNTNGRLGLGVTSPSQRLHVSGSAIITGSTGTATTLMGRDASGNISSVNLTTTGTGGAATISGNNLNIPIYSGGASPGGASGNVQFNNGGAFGGSTNFNWDNSNSRLSVGPITTASQRVQISGTAGQTPGFRILNSGITIPNFSGVGYSPAITTTTVAMIEQAGTSDGGIAINGFSATTGGIAPLFFTGIHGVTSPGTVTSCLFRGFKWNGTNSITAVTSDEIVAEFSAGNTALFDIRGNGNVNVGSKFTPDARLHVRGANTMAGVGALLIEDGAGAPTAIYRIDNDGKVTYRAANTAAGTTGAQTINRPSGTVNFAAGATSLVVTNSLCTTASIVLPVIRTNDATAQIKNVVPGSGFFTINLSAAATAETSVGFFIIN